jgi:hypothetical protein
MCSWGVRRCNGLVVALAIGVMGMAGCASATTEATVKLPAAASPAVSIVDATTRSGTGIALGDASEAVNRGERPRVDGGASDGGGSPDTGAAEDTASTEDTGATQDTEASDDTGTTDSTDDAVADDTATGDTDATVERLDDDSVTCVTARALFALQERTGDLSKEFQSSIAGAADSDAINAAFDDFIDSFNDVAEEITPELEEHWTTFSDAQPDLAEDIAAVRKATLGSFEVFQDVSSVDLDNFEEILSERVGQDVLIAGGLASLKLDGFTRAACDVPFANS